MGEKVSSRAEQVGKLRAVTKFNATISDVTPLNPEIIDQLPDETLDKVVQLIIDVANIAKGTTPDTTE